MPVTPLAQPAKPGKTVKIGRLSPLSAASVSDVMFIDHRKQLVELAARSRLPAVYPELEFVGAGGLMFYGASLVDMYTRAATHVDRILKGTKPADLPVEQPTKLELVINLRTAQPLRLMIPTSVLARADQVLQ